jgi:hypothetical protein
VGGFGSGKEIELVDEGFSMTIKLFELFHGAVLTKLVRKDRPVTVTLIETRQDEAWSVYKIIDCYLFIKLSTSPSSLSGGKGGYSWSFTFTPEHIKQIIRIREDSALYLALICGFQNVKVGRSEICFIDQNEIPEVIDLDNPNQQSLRVRRNTGAKKFRLFVDRKEKISIYLSALERWDIPGS